MIARNLVFAASLCTPVLWAGAHAQEFPVKPVRIVTAAPGSTNDLVTRVIAQGLTAGWGQQTIVENRAGGSGVIAAQTVAKAPADGYSILLYSSALWIGPLIQDLPWDVVRDFSPITLAASTPNILVVHPSLPVRSVKELVALAKKRPGELNYGSTSIGSSNHLGAELFKSKAGVNIVRVNYKGGGDALTALIGGHVQVAFVTAGLVTPYFKSGKLRPLAICSLQPSALAPGIPTVAAAGFAGIESGSIYGMFAPAKTPPAVIARLNQEIVRALSRPDLKERFLNLGIEALGNTPEEFVSFIKSDLASMGKLVKDAGIRIE
ncbi:MAG TPA: tripartite tricarboxylate transporter substrate binding protein [Burkholderiales bacterium]|nr:tripartite tricarboxylate transporter substrate binding protein [Burkholderiales bacterium]